MKVYFLSNTYQGCFYVRCLLPALHNGWDGAKKFLTSPLDSPEEMLDKALKADVVVFQRPDTPDKTEAIKLLKRAGKKIVFDNDDTYVPNSGFPMLDKPSNREFVENINKELYNNIKQADIVTTTTETLANEYRSIHNNVVILPNCIDPFDWEEPIRNDGDKVRIGLVGSVSFDDYKVIKPYLEELAERKDVQLVIFGLSRDTKGVISDMYKEMLSLIDKYNLEWQGQVPMEKYNETLNGLALDIMLIPRKENYFNKCKSNIKYLEASMCEIPVVASTFENAPYEELDGKIGIKTNNFKKEVDRLINNKKLRREIGFKAKQYVLKNYNIETTAYKWADAFKKL